jgi:EAL domain-containing protein (putative c-di-GMP-specific phosphodiesterase class I)
MLNESAVEPTLTSGIVSLAHSLNLLVVAEGVENQYQAETLIALGVDALQAHHYGRPAPLEFLTGEHDRPLPPTGVAASRE